MAFIMALAQITPGFSLSLLGEARLHHGGLMSATFFDILVL
jgi:hypothetical protein